MAQAKRAVSQPVSLPAPTGGWNARDSLTGMSPLDAVTLTNWYPATTECQLRKGYAQWATGISGQVQTVMAYSGGSTDKLFAINASGSVYDVTATGAVGAAVLTGLSNGKWGYLNIATAGGNFLSMANGVDAPRNYNGTTWSTPAITGVTATTLRDPILYAQRQFFIGDNTLKAWYLPVNSIAGAANAIDISALATKGGYIMAHGNWTIDAGAGVNDHYVLVTSRGQVIVYQGSDPSSATTWSMVGVWDLGAPIGHRCMFKWAGDMLIITQDGVVPMSAALQSSRVNPKVALTDKIQFAISDAVSNYAANFGWQLVYVATVNQLWLNVPIQVGTNQQQYVMNTINGSWCNYTGWNANCWEIFQDEPYFGGNGYVGRAWYTNADAGSNIQAFGLQAFNNFNNAGTLKRFTMSRPMFRTNGNPSIYAGINIDFNINDSTAPLTFSPPAFGTWDSSLWDAATWGGDLSILQYWQGLNGVGYYGAPTVKVASNTLDVRWVSTDIVIEGGAIL
jgi:hypothetical protein